MGKKRNINIIPFAITKKMTKDEGMDEFLKQSLLDASDKYEEELENDPELKDVEAPDEMLDNIKRELKNAGYIVGDTIVENNGAAESEGKLIEDSLEDVVAVDNGLANGAMEDDVPDDVTSKNIVVGENVKEDNKIAYTDLSEEEIQILHMSRSFIANGGDITSVERALSSGKNINEDGSSGAAGPKRGKRRFRVKYMIAVAAVCVGLFGVTMTSTANRENLMKFLGIQTSNGYSVTIFDEGNSSKTEMTPEEEAFADIYEKIGLVSPIMDTKPKNLLYKDYLIEDVILMANLTYYYADNDTFFNITMDGIRNDIYYSRIIDNAEIEKIVTTNYEIQMQEIINPETGEKSLAAQFEYLDCYYFISGIMDKEEFVDILVNMKFN